MTDEANNGTSADQIAEQAAVVAREEYRQQLINEHLGYGFPPEIAAQVADAAIALADDTSTFFVDEGNTQTAPINAQHGLFTGVAVMRAATRLLAGRMQFLCQQAEAQLVAASAAQAQADEQQAG